jgi:hypothetical protein
MRRLTAAACALAIATLAAAQALPPGWSSPEPATYRHDGSALVFGNRIARFELVMPPEVSGKDGASAINYMGTAVSKLTIYVLPPDRRPAPADEGEFIDALAGILQVLPQVEAQSVGTFQLAENGRKNQGRIATFRFKAQERVMGTLLIVVAARRHILKFRATYPSADEQKALVHVGESISELLGQEIELVTKPVN